MKLTEINGGGLMVEHDDTRVARLLLAIGLALLLLGLYRYYVTHDREKLVGGSAAFATCVVAWFFVGERAVFRVEPQMGLIRWKRRRMFVSREGAIHFSDVRSVLVQTPIGDRGIPSRRVAIITRDGKEFPIATAYKPDNDDACPALAARLREVLSIKPLSEGAMADVAALAAEGREMDAIRSLRGINKGMSLADARAEVKRMREQSAGKV